MTDRVDELGRILERMLTENQPITARAVVRASAGLFRHASDVTRHPRRRKLLEEFAARQTLILKAIESSSRKSKSALEKALARKQQQIDELVAQRDLLIASHRAAILAVTELGGYPVWKRFFGAYEDVATSLVKMGALAPETDSNTPS